MTVRKTAPENAQIYSPGARINAMTPRFRTRNYKHELALAANHQRWVGHYSDAMWETLCQRLVEHNFTGLVFYAGYHPFEFLLDYRDRPEVASHPEAERTATRQALRRGLAIAHRHGLKTFLQHYVGHFTKELAELRGIATAGRYSNTEHPAVADYCRYCYREIFRQVPELDGLYFNFESFGNAHEHLLATAIPEFNAMPQPPILVFRLWGYTNYEGMASMLRAYHGRVILGHKVMDTTDAYYLPVADSRVREWKKRLGPNIEWMFLVGPCHNCGTNLCGQLWADYDFVQTLLADAQAKGADSISFNTHIELFCADLPDPHGIFSEHEKNLSRFNRMHVLAASDYVIGKKRTPAQRALTMAELNGVSPAAGRSLLEAIDQSSQLILLIFQQFYLTSAYDGYLNCGRYSTIQEPFYYYPATELNHQAKQNKLLFPPGWGSAWVSKTIDTTVAPDGTYQYIIDAVNPALARNKAPLNPMAMARLLDRHARRSEKCLRDYRRTAGKAAADILAPYITRNALVGDYVRQEILAATSLYSLYFPKSPTTAIHALKNGLSALQAAAALIPDRKAPEYKQLVRTLMLDIKPEIEIGLAGELLAALTVAKVPWKAFDAYIESHRRYNEIRRVIRAGRPNGPAHLRHARKCLDAALQSVEAALAALADPAHGTLRTNVTLWRDYLVWVRRNELVAPRAICAGRQGTPPLPLQHNNCFRTGEDFLKDFTSFFQPVDFMRAARLSMRIWRTRQELVVQLHEDGIGLGGRKARWLEYHGEGSDSHVLRLFIDVENSGKRGDTYIVFPVGGGVARGTKREIPHTMELADHDDSWDMTVHLPFKVLGRTPRKGETWGFNLTANPFVTRNTCYTWAPQYDANNPLRYGKLTFS